LQHVPAASLCFSLQLQTEAQAWKIQALVNALQQSHFEAERRIVVLQKENQEKLHVMLRHFAEESSGSSGTEAASRRLHLTTDADLGKYKRENRILKKRIQDLEALLKTDARGEQHKSLVYCYEILLSQSGTFW
jgi:costal 2 protein